MSSSSPVTSGTLAVPDGRLYYEVRGSGPLIALVGAPMEAEPFAAVADALATDHTVLTMDPRGHGRSELDDPNQDSTPELRADDLARLITHLGVGPAAVFGSSGGAVTGLALVLTHPEVVHTLIAHEPPVREYLDDRAELRAVTADILATYGTDGPVPAMRKFFALTGIPVPDFMIEQMFGGERDPRVVAGERFWFEHEFNGTVEFRPDFEALRAAPARIIIGIGDASAGQFCDRTSRALAAGLGIEPELFPGGHGGFTEDAESFAKRVREVL